MKNLIISLFLLLPIITFSQNKICENISFNSFEIIGEEEKKLVINVAIEDENSLMPIGYPGFILINETGDTVAYTTMEYATYSLGNNVDYRLKMEKEIAANFSGTMLIHKGYVGGPLKQMNKKVCSLPVSFKLASEENAAPSIGNAIYLEYQGNETQGAGSIKKANSSEWYEYGEEGSAIIGIYRETHRDENYIYLISRDAIFQFDLTRKKIMKNGVDLLDISTFSNEGK